MKKLAIVCTTVLLLFALVGCGTFSYNIRNYVDVADYKTVTIKQTKIDSEVDSSRKSLLSNYKGEDDVTTGTVEDGMTAYIYYSGTLKPYEGPFAFKMGENTFKGLDEALKDVEFVNGKATVEFTLATDFTVPEEIAKAMKQKADAAEAAAAETTEPTATEETPTETPTETQSEAPAAVNSIAAVLRDGETTTADAEPTPAATGETETETPEDPYAAYNAYYPGKTIKVEVTVEGKNGKLEDGEQVPAIIKITHVFPTGTYNADSETSKTDEDRKGQQLTIGSGKFIKGFEEGMLGMSVEKGTKKTLEIAFPSPYASEKAFSGIDVDFEVEIQSVTKIYERDLSDATQFAALKADYEAANGKGSFAYADEADYMAGLTKNVKASLASDAVVAASKVKKWKYSDLDDYKVTARNTIINYYMQLYVYYMGSYPTSETDIISTFFTSNDAYQQTIADQAGMQLKTDWVLYQVAKDQELDTVSDEEYNKFITEQLASQNVGVSEEYQIDEATLVKNMGGKSVVKKYVILDKAQKWLGENITVV